jgi:DGQHR domain-containing protein
MKFFFADSLDCVDPNFDFIRDCTDPTRNRQSGDVFAHELMGQSSYHGILLSYATVGNAKATNRFAQGQRIRLYREGVREFYRFPQSGYSGDPLDYPIMGDSGSFSFRDQENPPYTQEELFDFYHTCGFTHGVALDHIIAEKNTQWDDSRCRPAEVEAKYERTLTNARDFLNLHRKNKATFIPIGVIQAWSPRSAARQARALVDLGYHYIGLGGVAARPTPEIVQFVGEIRQAIPDDIHLHVFGLARFGTLKEFQGLGIASFDSSSPMLKAFKDDKANYYLPDGRSYLAVRMPSTLDPGMGQRLAAGDLNPEVVDAKEKRALDALRSLDKDPDHDPRETLEAIGDYTQTLGLNSRTKDYQRLFHDKPWQQCPCPVCTKIGVEVMIFRGLDRNKRRGFHNLWTLRQMLDKFAEESCLEVPCIRAEQNPGKAIYSFIVNGQDILKFARISRIRRNDEGALLGYQRTRVEDHINDIRTYLEKKDSLLPNSLVVAFDDSVSFQPTGQGSATSQTGNLRIPIDFESRPGWIVDGQQRATALNRLVRKDFPVSVVAFHAENPNAEREQFVLVNNVRPLPKSLVYELLPSLEDAVPPRYRKRQRAYRILERLNADEDSPFYQRIRTETTKHLKSAFIKDLSILKMIENSFENGALALYPKSEKEPLRILKTYWKAVAEIFPDAWDLPPRKSRLTHGVGIISMGYLMDAVVARMRLNKIAFAIPFVKREIKKVGDLPWCGGSWDFESDLILPWDQVQNTNLHINLVANFLIRVYQKR